MGLIAIIVIIAIVAYCVGQEMQKQEVEDKESFKRDQAAREDWVHQNDKSTKIRELQNRYLADEMDYDTYFAEKNAILDAPSAFSRDGEIEELFELKRRGYISEEEREKRDYEARQRPDKGNQNPYA